MSNIIQFPMDECPFVFDGVFLITWPMLKVQGLLVNSRTASSLDGRRWIARVCRTCVRAMIDGESTGSGERGELFGLTASTARERMKNLLDLADQLEDQCLLASDTGA